MLAVDRLWYLDGGQLNPDASAVAKAVEDYLAEERRRGINVPEPEVEEAARVIPHDAPAELQGLAGRMMAPLSGAPVALRHIAAENCHRFDREQYEDHQLDDSRSQVVKVPIPSSRSSRHWCEPASRLGVTTPRRCSVRMAR